ncbi:organic solute transporter subunit alpha-like [Haliotis cracherodii]|uniref:organic solute transporter subunit alpha-like n=1 Tax=Haliotis cracherodii TaxID=6455 RepID=UPI0039EA5EB4
MGSEAPNTTMARCPFVAPISETYFAEISTGEVAALAVGAVITLANVVMFVESARFLVKHLPVQKANALSIWLTGLPTVFAVTSLVAVLVPRSALLSDLLAAIYASFCVFIFIKLLIHYYGGTEAYINHMSGETINLRSPPVACCCVCCPKIAVNEKNLFRIKMSVLQFAIIRPIMVLVTISVWSDNKYVRGLMMPLQAFPYLNVLNVASTMIAIYGSILLFGPSRKHLKAFNIGPKFLCCQLVLVLSDIQTAVFDNLALNNIPPCTPILSSATRGDVWNHLVMIVEMFLIALLARHLYRRIDGSQVISDICLEDKNKVQHENSSLKNNTNILKHTSSEKESEDHTNHM